MMTSFEYLDRVDTRAMSELIESMMDVLESLDEGLIPNDSDYTLEHLQSYLTSLVRGQRKRLGRTRSGSWAVVPDDAGMDADARVDFIFRPTYIATATLSRALCEFPLLALSILNYRRALQTGMRFCSHRSLQGHGYEADSGAIDALRILSLGKIPWLLHRHPDACPELKAAIDDVANGMAQRLLDGNAVGMWGEDYSEGFRSAVETLRLKNDQDFMASVELARRDSTTLSKDDLPW
jgi:hypothetical protein